MAEDREQEPSSGVMNLIDKVRSEAVDAGERQAKQIVDEARQRAARIVDDARTEAERHLSEARAQAERETAAGRAALEQAARDTILRLQEELMQHFGRQVRRLVEEEFRDDNFLQRLILELVGKERPSEPDGAQVLLPARAVGFEQLEADNPELGRDPVDAFVLEVSRAGLREGVTLKPDQELEAGVRILLHDGEVEVEVSPEAVAELLDQHLLPRFRGLLEGVFR
ncbi:MAG TPA: hypothetical protein RMG48_20420 [Myxococcales bacterium LLY-WYZ-16_1]|jgi:V/A-type H+/Na+-transporting ATPase subunit E|nr:hypothetical protein [Myxococcales bacterium LLY-WYZ-16_1]